MCKGLIIGGLAAITIAVGTLVASPANACWGGHYGGGYYGDGYYGGHHHAQRGWYGYHHGW